MALTNTFAKKAKDKAYKPYDSEGLFLLSQALGKKYSALTLYYALG